MTCQTAQLILSSGRLTKPWSGQVFASIRAATDSPLAPFFRVSPSCLDQITSNLTPEDQAVISFLSQVRLATGFQLARRLWAAKNPPDAKAQAARRALARLEQWRLIDRLGRRMGGVRGGSSSIVYGLGPSGRRLLARSGEGRPRLGTPGDRYVAHCLAVTELIVRLYEATLRGDLDVIDVQAEPACWRQYLGGWGSRFTLKPDLFLRIGLGALEDRWWLEVDMSSEAVPTIQAKAQRYLDYYRNGSEQQKHGVFPRVVWVGPDSKRAEQLRTALSKYQRSVPRLFVVWPYDEVVGRLIQEAAS